MADRSGLSKGALHSATPTKRHGQEPETAAYPNSVQSTFQYDPLNRLTGTATTNNAGYLYSLGPTGIKTGATELGGRTVAWSFDGIYRLTGETYDACANVTLTGGRAFA
jgi:hypothetical protein